jgi:hypothetical protein
MNKPALLDQIHVDIQLHGERDDAAIGQILDKIEDIDDAIKAAAEGYLDGSLDRDERPAVTVQVNR